MEITKRILTKIIKSKLNCYNIYQIRDVMFKNAQEDGTLGD